MYTASLFCAVMFDV